MSGKRTANSARLAAELAPRFVTVCTLLTARGPRPAAKRDNSATIRREVSLQMGEVLPHYIASHDRAGRSDGQDQGIHDQRTHHATMTFEEEFIAMLTKHGVQYDPRYVWG